MTTTTRRIAYGWILPDEPVIVVTDEDMEMIFSPVRQELDAMDSDLEALRATVRPVFRLTHEQECELEADRPEQPGVAEVAPYIAF